EVCSTGTLAGAGLCEAQTAEKGRKRCDSVHSVRAPTVLPLAQARVPVLPREIFRPGSPTGAVLSWGRTSPGRTICCRTVSVAVAVGRGGYAGPAPIQRGTEALAERRARPRKRGAGKSLFLGGGT